MHGATVLCDLRHVKALRRDHARSARHNVRFGLLGYRRRVSRR